MVFREYMRSLYPVLDRENKFMFFSINKVVQTSINRKLLKDRVLVYKDNPKLWIEKFDSYSNKEIESLYKFTIVRNPWDKVVSFYFYYKRLSHRKTANFASFNEFVCKCLRYEGSEYDAHLEKQHPKAYFNGQIFVDKIGKFENIRTDWEEIASRIDCNSKLPHANRTHHKHYSEYYTPESSAIIADIYNKDIKLFNYKYMSRKGTLMRLPVRLKNFKN